MNHPDYDYMMVMERRRDELAAADHARLVKAARAASRRNTGIQQFSRLRPFGNALMLSFAHFLSATGDWLLKWSCRLQTQVELFREGTAEKSPGPCA